MPRTSPFLRSTRQDPDRPDGPDGPDATGPGPWAAEAAAVAVVALVTLVTLAAMLRIARPPHPEFQAAAAAAAVLLFPLRRIRHAPVLLVLAALAGLAPGAGPVLAATAYAAARRTAPGRRRAWLPVAASAVVTVVATVAGPRVGPGSLLYGAALGLVLAVTAVVVPGLVGTVQGQQGRLVRALRERGDASERARLLADSEARIHERSRIAAEMHDLVGHRLSLVSLHAGGLELALERAAPELRDEAVLVRRTTGDAMRELRRALGVLGPLGRDTGVDVLTDATGTRADIEALVEDSRAGGIDVRSQWHGPDLLDRPAPVRRTVHRVVREALTNVHRYAATAHTTVAVTHDDTAVSVTVRNGAPATPRAAAPADGSGPTPGTGRGLTGLRERTELLGGVFAAGALPSGGFQVHATVPAEADEAVAVRAAGAGTPDATDPQPLDVSRHIGPVAPAHRSAQWLMAACGTVAVCVSMVIGVGFVYATEPSSGSGPQPLPHVGMTYEQVAGSGVLDNAAVRAAATGHEPPRPAGAIGCVYPFNGATEHRPGVLTVARYCFDGSSRLIAIDRFPVPSVQDATPWESP
ncbi:sensor histidine kinase [Streptomyces sp. NPDC088097]|uniref:sensor histidine kinase n=1 Tax=Streptomyces sp. NPDC088097 TaxID=3365823 RepID=UPI0037F7D4E1